MKIITTTIVLLVAFYSALQAQTIDYGYDSAGNRESRTHTSSSDATTESDNMLENLAFDDILALVEDTNNQENKKNAENQENNSLITFSVYPNPTSNQISISKTGSDIVQETESVYILLDSKGKTLDTIKTKNNLVTFQLNHLAKGTYYIYFINSDEKQAWQVVKN